MKHRVVLYTGQNGYALFQEKEPFIAAGEPHASLPYSLYVDRDHVSILSQNMYQINQVDSVHFA